MCLKLYIQKIFVRVQGNVWCNLKGHTTRRNDFKAGKSDFCRLFKNDTPKSQNPILAAQKSFFQT